MTVHWATTNPEPPDLLPFDPADIALLLGHPDCQPEWPEPRPVTTLPDINTWQETHD